MSKDRTGALETRRDADGKLYYRARIRLADGSRPRFRVPEKYSYSRERAAQWAKWLQEQEDERGGLVAKRKEVAAALAPKATTSEGDKWFDAWEASRVAKGLTSTRDNRSHWREHIRGAVDGKHVRDWTQEDVRTLVRYLDGKVQAGELSWKFVQNVWGTAGKMCADAMSSKLDALRVRTDDPSASVEGPDRGESRAKQFLYPNEFLKLVSCRSVPLHWRVAVTLAIFFFPRHGELKALSWEDVDLEHGTVNIHRAWDRRARALKATKTGRGRRFNVEPALLPLLRAMHEATGGKGNVIPIPSERAMARDLRRWLKHAGVTRFELHDTKCATSKPLTFHDLRATGLTWMAVRGDEPLKIMQRAGHSNFGTTQIYVRTAEAIRDGFGESFPPLPLFLAFEVSRNGPLGWPTDRLSARNFVEPTGIENVTEDELRESLENVVAASPKSSPSTAANSADARSVVRSFGPLSTMPWTQIAGLAEVVAGRPDVASSFVAFAGVS